MASFGHLAVGMMAGRLQRGAWKGGPRPDAAGAPGAMSCRAAIWVIPILTFAVLGLLPDFDLIVVALGASDSAAGGHRGGSHSLLTAIALGIGAGVVAKRIGWCAIRTALAVTLAVGSHGILDARAAAPGPERAGAPEPDPGRRQEAGGGGDHERLAG